SMVLLPGRFVLATTAEFLRSLVSPSAPGFGVSNAYQSVIGSGSGDGTAVQLVVDIAAIKDAIVKNLPAADRANYEKDVAPQVDPLQAFGLRAFQEGGFSHVEMKLSLK